MFKRLQSLKEQQKEEKKVHECSGLFHEIKVLFCRGNGHEAQVTP